MIILRKYIDLKGEAFFGYWEIKLGSVDFQITKNFYPSEVHKIPKNYRFPYLKYSKMVLIYPNTYYYYISIVPFLACTTGSALYG